MSGCVALTAIDLDNNKLTAAGLEPFCSNPPPNLTKLEMRSCGLQGTYLGQPVVLAHINGSLFPHVREELPATIGNLQALEDLSVHSNRLSGTCLVEPVLQLTHISALPRTMSQLQALQKLYVGGNQLQYSDVEFIIKRFPQLTELGINRLGLTGRFAFCKSRTS